MMKNKYNVSFFILTANNVDLLTNCFNSIFSSVTRHSFEIILVDSSSDLETYEFIGSSYSNVKYIKNDSFHGFSSGNNQAFKHSSGEYICILNDDTILKRHCIDLLIEELENDNCIGAIGPKLLNKDGSLQVSSFNSFPKLYSEIITTSILIGFIREKFVNLFKSNKSINNYGEVNLIIDRPVQVKHLMGACIVMPAKLFENLNGFDENFFLSMEDQDLCRRVLNNNRKVVYFPSAELIHLGGQTVSRLKGTFNKIYLESKLYFFKKYHPYFYSIIYILVTFISVTNVLVLLTLFAFKRRNNLVFSHLRYEWFKLKYLLIRS
jgi:GT2 family glycosyltransferase